MSWEEILLRLALSAVVGALVKGAVALADHSIAWGWALLIGFCLVNGILLIIDLD